MLEARLRGGLCEGNSVRRGVGMSAVTASGVGPSYGLVWGTEVG